MSDPLEDSKMEVGSTTNTDVNTSKIEINAWRKSRSFIDPNSSLMLERRFTQGEMIHFCYESILN
jgi:hypothetical protein